MKNVHILPTNKQSRLFKFENKLIKNDLIGLYDFKEKGYIGQNIYITSDEELVLGEYHFNSKYGNEPQKTNQRDIDSRKYWEEEDYVITKIILTTDQDLIKDGVQAINDKFLEWFVKNSSCKNVGVFETYNQEKNTCSDNCKWGCHSFFECENVDDTDSSKTYEITIPKEKPKRDLEKEMFELEQELDIPSSMRWHNSKPKQKIKYSEEEVFHMLVKAIKDNKVNQLSFFDGGMSNPIYTNLNKWFEQFKKKQ
jgi:hypothetical protein